MKTRWLLNLKLKFDRKINRTPRASPHHTGKSSRLPRIDFPSSPPPSSSSSPHGSTGLIRVFAAITVDVIAMMFKLLLRTESRVHDMITILLSRGGAGFVASTIFSRVCIYICVLNKYIIPTLYMYTVYTDTVRGT